MTDATVSAADLSDSLMPRPFLRTSHSDSMADAARNIKKKVLTWLSLMISGLIDLKLLT